MSNSSWNKLSVKFALLLGASLLVAARVSSGADGSGLAIALQADQADDGFASEKSTVSLDLIDAHGQVTKRRMSVAVLEVKNEGDKTRAEVSWPPDVKGTKLLTFAHKHTEDDQWLYLPAIKRVKRISASSKSGSFMGSEFAYEDLTRPEVERFKYGEQTTVQEQGRACWRFERYPVDPHSGYQRQIVWMDKEYKWPLKIEYYDRRNELLKVQRFAGYTRSGRYWRWQSLEMNNVQTGKRSIMTWESRTLGSSMGSSEFDSASLGD